MGEPGESTATTGFLGRLLGRGVDKPQPQPSFFDPALQDRIQTAAYEGLSHPDPEIRDRFRNEYEKLTGRPLREIASLETIPVYAPEPETHVSAADKAAVFQLRDRAQPPVSSHERRLPTIPSTKT